MNFKKRNRKEIFRGWYFKQQGKDLTISFIPAVFYDSLGGESATLQVVFDGKVKTIKYEKATIIDNKEMLYIVMGDNMFSDQCIYIDIEEDDLVVKGTLLFDEISDAKFDAMGPLKFLPLECKHDIISMSHKLKGELTVNGHICSFDGGIGYVEMDQGKSFPSQYLWTQCNDFHNNSCSLMVAVAKIPFAGRSFLGCICAIAYKNKKYKFATYNGAKVKEFSKEGFRITSGDYTLSGEFLGGEGITLKSPEMGQLTNTTVEYLQCKMSYRLKRKNTVIFQLESENASFEFY
ncbi:MAG: tocopherol cyclase family protein [Anaerovoracaceae bacterium]